MQHIKVFKTSCAYIIATFLNVYFYLKLFALSVEQKSEDMRGQRKKQETLIMKMLPKSIVQRVLSGDRTSQAFQNATLYFSTVDEFHRVSRECSYDNID